MLTPAVFDRPARLWYIEEGDGSVAAEPEGGLIMERDNRVVKASNIYYINSNQPDRLYQIAEDYYQTAQEYEREALYLKARIYYQKAEELYQKARDVYKARKQADKAKKQADEAREQADEARRQAGENFIPPKTPRRTCKAQPAPPPVYWQPPSRQQPPKPQGPQTALISAPAQISRASQKETPQKAVSQSVQHADEGIRLPAVHDTPDIADKKVNRPISWKGKRHG